MAHFLFTSWALSVIVSLSVIGKNRKWAMKSYILSAVKANDENRYALSNVNIHYLRMKTCNISDITVCKIDLE